MESVDRPRYVIRTLGCKANYADSERIEAELCGRGWIAHRKGEGNAALCIVNSCTVTDEADRQSRKLASRLSREHPEARVVVTGCAAEVDPERLSRSAGIHYVIGNRDKPALVELILRELPELAVGEAAAPTRAEILGAAEGYDELLSRHPEDREWPLPEQVFEAVPSEISARTRVFLKIQEGCNAFCTYCVIPYGRGPSRSLHPDAVVARVNEVVSAGAREVIITGTNIGDYGTDWAGEGSPASAGLVALFRRIFRETRLERLRVSSLDPTEITPELIGLMGTEPRFCPHFHVSLQSPHPRILRMMKRRYGFEEVRSCLERIAALDSRPFVGMDVIAGFPGETLEEFEWGMEKLRALPWSRLHVFPYSERAGTPATRLAGSVPMQERVRRARQLQELSLDRVTAVARQAIERCEKDGVELEGVLMERPVRGPHGKLHHSGYTTGYLRVLIEAGPESLRNRIISARPTGLWVDPSAGDAAVLAAPRSSG